MADDEGTDALDYSDVTMDIDFSGQEFWTKLRIWALADPTFGQQLLATAGAVAAVLKLANVPSPPQAAASQAKHDRIKALSSNTFGGTAAH